MPAARIPTDETDRLQALRSLDVLDTLPEAFSDAIATAAAAIAGVPISAVSLVDAERQWFKASCGLAVSETSRDSSFCAHAILAGEPLLIADTLADERFRDNPLVTGAPYIRAYAGFPLVVGGQAVGALCVIDDRPRVFSVDAVEQLTRLATGTSAWLTDRQHLSGSLEHTREQLRQVTFHDPATGLPTRILLQDRLMQVVRRADRTKQRVAVLYLRLRTLDSTGQPTVLELDGETLHAAGQRLTRAVRAVDTVSRVGDSDFVILAEGQGNIEAARRLAASIRTAFEPAIPRGACDLRLGAAIGVSLYPQDGAGERLVGHAALACTQPAARSDCAFFHRELEQAEQLRSDLLDQLRRALERNELELHYQPQFDARSGDVAGVEALVRWRHPVLGRLLPMDFIPLAEESGLIEDIGRWVMAEAFGQIRRWREIGVDLRVAINLSARQLRRPALAEEIEALMRNDGVDPASVTFEVTESVTMDDATSAAFVFERLRVLGVQISIDDFGTGYSNLPYLRRLCVRQLKIDKSVVAELDGGDDAHAVVQAIIQLGHAMRLELVAEGVETEAQRRVLCELGCDRLQGFLLARPMPAEALAAWMSHREARTAFA